MRQTEQSLMVIARAQEGRLDELEEWYRSTHLIDMLALGVFRRARLMRAGEDNPLAEVLVVIYELAEGVRQATAEKVVESAASEPRDLPGRRLRPSTALRDVQQLWLTDLAVVDLK